MSFMTKKRQPRRMCKYQSNVTPYSKCASWSYSLVMMMVVVVVVVVVVMLLLLLLVLLPQSARSEFS